MEERALPEVPPEFDRIFRARSGLVFRTAYRITGNASDAEDVLQEVFIRFLKRKETGPLENEESYFRRAAINGALDAVRLRAGEKSVVLSDISVPPVQPAPGDLKQRVRLALGKIKPRDAEIFALRFFEEYSNQEIAGLLGISQILVAVIIHRTRRQLKQELS